MRTRIKRFCSISRRGDGLSCCCFQSEKEKQGGQKGKKRRAEEVTEDGAEPLPQVNWKKHCKAALSDAPGRQLKPKVRRQCSSCSLLCSIVSLVSCVARRAGAEEGGCATRV